MADLVYLHIGCANLYYQGFINSDSRTSWKGKPHKLDKVMDISLPWPYENESVDGIVSMHVLQQLTWRELIAALRESKRVLKKGCKMRIGVPMIENGKSLDYLLGWKNVNLFCREMWDRVLMGHIKFSEIKWCKYQETDVPIFKQVDNRPEQTFYIEVTK